MKKLFLMAFLATLATEALAQDAGLSGTVVFTGQQEQAQAQKKVQEAEEAPADTPSAVKKVPGELPKVDTAAVLARTTKRVSAMNNPRIAKKGYARLKEMQESIEKAQQEKLNEKTYPDEKAKEEALKEIKNKALVRFEDYEDKPEDVKQKINNDPQKSLIEISDRIKYSLDHNEEHLDSVQSQLKEDFKSENGMGPEEYMDAYVEQVEMELQQEQQAEQKAETFPILTTDKDVKVEKQDDQNALLYISVGAPRSNKE